MNTLSLFNFNGHDVRVVMIDGAPWWVAADVCRALSAYVYGGKVNVTMATQKLEPYEVRFNPIEPSPGAQARRFVTVSESGLYKLIMRSDKPQARASPGLPGGPPPHLRHPPHVRPRQRR